MNDAQWVFIVATLLAAAGMWLMLPRGGGRAWIAGALLMVGGLACGAMKLPGLGHWLADSVFFLLAGVTVLGAVATVTMRNPVYCALWFGLSLLGTAGLFLLAGAQFLAVATVVVYAGAILVTFLFVLMLAGPRGTATYDRTSWEALVSAALGMVIVGIFSMAISGMLGARDGGGGLLMADAAPAVETLQENILADQHVVHLSAELFGRHLIAIEVAGTLLLVALVGAAVIAGQSRSNQVNQQGAE